MPLFSAKSSLVTVTFNYKPTRLVKHEDPSLGHLEASSHAEANKIQDFVSYKNMQNNQSRADLKRLSQHVGREIMPPVRNKIGPDKNSRSSMNHFVGADWPSLRHDFGVTAPDSDVRAAEFRINFEHEIPSYFPSLVPLMPHFEKLGLNIDEFQEMMVDMHQTQFEIFDTKQNPHPKDKFGRKRSIDFAGMQLVERNEARYHYQYNFNKWADEIGAYVHIRFESINQYARDRSAFNQDLVFVFPTSNEEREIWRHVFLGEEYPEAGFPVETSYAQELAELQRRGQRPPMDANSLAIEFSRMSLPAQAPSSFYNADFARR